MRELTVVHAGAGSGKTWDLCENAVVRIAGGLDPARILATTFTRKAAAELKARIQERVLTDGNLAPSERLRKLERLELAAIGTVHSVGYQLLTRYAILVGISPELLVLEEEASKRVLLDVLSHMDPAPWEQLTRITHRFSLPPAQEVALKLLQAKRTNQISGKDFRSQIQLGGDRLVRLMAPDGGSQEDVTFTGLYELAGCVLDELEALTNDSTQVTETAKSKLRQMLASRTNCWTDFLLAMRIKAGKKSGADGHLVRLRAFASEVLLSSQLHQDVRDLLEQITSQTMVLSEAYARFKQERGLLDFTDLEVLFLELLNNTTLVASLEADFEFIAVDEFQDTNPIQLAIFQRLRHLAGASRWVGDAKQSIYGFQGADSELVNLVWENAPIDRREVLPKSYRSQAGLVQLVGRLFRRLFGDEVELEPTRHGIPRGIERWVLSATNNKQEFEMLATGIAQLHAEGIRLGNMAVLTRTNRNAQDIGSACKALGLPTVLRLPGLLETREGTMIMAGLRLVADRYDSLAAATILHLQSDPNEETPHWLATRLQAVKEANSAREAALAAGEEPASTLPPWADNPGLQSLEAIDHRVLSPSAIVQQVTDALNIGNHLRTWGDVAKRTANVDALLYTAQEYEEEMRELGSAATLTGLIAYLEDLSDSKQDFAGTPYGIDAVTILTYHRSKGLEWPVVILTGLNFERPPEMWEPCVSGGGEDPENPLEGRVLRYWPWPFGRDQYNRLLQGSGLELAALQSEEGQGALTREGAEAQRLLYVGFTRARDKLVLAHRQDKYTWLRILPDVDAVLPPSGTPGEYELQGIETTFLLKHIDETLSEEFTSEPIEAQTWLSSLRVVNGASEVGPRYQNPSEISSREPTPMVTIVELAGQPMFLKAADDHQYEPLGNAVHAYLSSMPSTESLDTDKKCKIAERCLLGFGAENLLSPKELVARGEQLKRWIIGRYANAIWWTEVPVTAPRVEGGQWIGVVDLLLQLPGQEVLVIDHKTSPIRREQCQAKASSFAGQLDAYREVLVKQGLAVRETWIHFPLASVMALVASS